MPLFEFFNTVSNLGVKKAFLRDMAQAWYHRGVAAIGPDIPSVAEHLTGVVRESGVRRTVVVGNSAGGYAALLFGHLLNADEVHAFAPQTFIAPRIRKEYEDYRYFPFVDRLATSGGMDGRFADLMPVLSAGGVRTQFHIHFRVADRLESLHAGRLAGAGIEGVILHPSDFGGEKLIAWFRDTGELTAILERALEPKST